MDFGGFSGSGVVEDFHRNNYDTEDRPGQGGRGPMVKPSGFQVSLLNSEVNSGAGTESQIESQISEKVQRDKDAAQLRAETLKKIRERREAQKKSDEKGLGGLDGQSMVSGVTGRSKSSRKSLKHGDKLDKRAYAMKKMRDRQNEQKMGGTVASSQFDGSVSKFSVGGTSARSGLDERARALKRMKEKEEKGKQLRLEKAQKKLDSVTELEELGNSKEVLTLTGPKLSSGHGSSKFELHPPVIDEPAKFIDHLGLSDLSKQL